MHQTQADSKGRPPASRKIALIIEYDGARYAGFQYQKNAPTIQAELEQAIERLTLTASRVHGAGRTDAGVHASGQVVAFATPASLPCETFVRGLNRFLPPDIAVQQAYEVDAAFDPRRSALSRVYRYTFLLRATPSPLQERYAYRVPHALDAQAMAAALRCIKGIHDFAALVGPGESGASTVREVFATDLWQENETLRFRVEGSAFLPQQMRRTAGMLLLVGQRRMSVEAVSGLLAGVARKQASKIATLPPQGLCLMRVTYKDFPPYEH